MSELSRIQNSSIYIHQKNFLINNTYKPKTLIFTWTQSVKNPSPAIAKFWGLGDILRGMISFYQYCKQKRHNFKFDISHHPLGKYFEYTSPCMVCLPENNTYFHGRDGLEYETLQIPDEDNYQVFTNVWPRPPLTDDEVRIIPSVLKIKDEFKLSLPPAYDVYHLRFNDQDITCTEPTSEMITLLEHVASVAKPADILCTNVPLLKRIAKSKYGLNSYNDSVNGSHSGYEQDKGVLDSVISDYQIISNAATIHTYSSYSWVSGFVQWVAIAFNKPLTDIKTGIRIN